jgi:hypothetical protein
MPYKGITYQQIIALVDREIAGSLDYNKLHRAQRTETSLAYWDGHVNGLRDARRVIEQAGRLEDRGPG